MIYNYKTVSKIALDSGWKLLRTKGSHAQFKKDGVKHLVTIPNHGSKDIPNGLANKILKALGVK